MIVKTAAKILVVGVIYSMTVFIFLPGLFSSRCGPISAKQLSLGALRSIIQAHMLNTALCADDGILTIDDVRHDLAPFWYSRSVEPKYIPACRWNRQTSDIITISVFATGIILCVIVLTKRWLRNSLIILASMCIFIILIIVISRYFVGGFMRTSSYAFVDDYVLLPNTNWREPETARVDGVIAFEKHPWPRANRVVARNAWSVRVIKESEFQKILTQQPEAKRAWNNCLKAGECKTVEQLQFSGSVK